jgi:hypothetical protein
MLESSQVSAELAASQEKLQLHEVKSKIVPVLNYLSAKP